MAKVYTRQWRDRAAFALMLRRAGLTYREISECIKPVSGKYDHITKSMAEIYVNAGIRLERQSG